VKPGDSGVKLEKANMNPYCLCFAKNKNANFVH